MRYFCLGAVLCVFMLSACGPKMYVKHDMKIPVSPATLKRNASVLPLTYVLQRQAELREGNGSYNFTIGNPEPYIAAFRNSAGRNLDLRILSPADLKKSVIVAGLKKDDGDYFNLTGGPLFIRDEHAQILPTIAREAGADAILLAQINWELLNQSGTWTSKGVMVSTTLNIQVYNASGQLIYSAEKSKSNEAKAKMDTSALGITMIVLSRGAPAIKSENVWAVLTANVVDLWDETLGEVAAKFGVKKN